MDYLILNINIGCHQNVKVNSVLTPAITFKLPGHYCCPKCCPRNTNIITMAGATFCWIIFSFQYKQLGHTDYYNHDSYMKKCEGQYLCDKMAYPPSKTVSCDI